MYIYLYFKGFFMFDLISTKSTLKLINFALTSLIFDLQKEMRNLLANKMVWLCLELLTFMGW